MDPIELGSDAEAIAATAAAVAHRRVGDGLGFDSELFRALGETGVLALGTPEGGGGAAEVVGVMLALGGHVWPTPLVSCYLATQLLVESERTSLAAGDAVAGIAADGLVTMGIQATVLIEVVGTTAWRVEPAGDLVPVPTIGGEPWARGPVRRLEPLGDATQALALTDLAAGAWMIGAGLNVLAFAADHAAGREQFGRPISSFQAISHKLARARAELDASMALVTGTAVAYDRSGPSRWHAATARFAASRAALLASTVSHQVTGALGFTVEAGIGGVSAAVRQCASSPPGDRRALVDAIVASRATS